MAETKREEDSQTSTEQCTKQPAGTSNQTATNHDQVSIPTMHTKLANAPVPSSQTSQLPLEPTTVVPTSLTSLVTTTTHPDVEISEEVCPKNSEPSSPASEEDFSSGGEQISFPDDPKAYVPHQFAGNNQFYMMPIPNGVSGAGPEGLMSSALPNTAWGGASDAGMPEGSYVHVMDSASYLPHSQPMDGPDPMSPPPEGEGLQVMLIRQLEYYFSKENLSSDKYLLSQMDGDHFVSVSVIAGFSKVKRLTGDINLIMDAIRESHNLQLDETAEKVRAVPEKRCVLILREIPKETPPEHIKGLFSSDHCPNFSTCEFAENDCWYITFDSEEDTQKAFAYLREEVRDFLGQPIRARIKGTSVQRPSVVSKKPPQYYPMQNVYNGQQPVQYYSQPMSQWPPYYPSDPSNYIPYVNGYAPPQGFGGPPNHYQNHPPMSHSHPSHTHPPPGDRPSGGRMMGGGMGGRSYTNHSNYSSDRSDRRSHPGSSGTSSGVSNGNVGGREEREGRRGERDRERERERDREQYGSSGGGRRGKDDDVKKNIPRLRKQARESELRGQRPPPQKAIDHSPAHFPPLAGGSTIPAAPPPPPPPPEQGISNLADIVKGKHLKESTSPTGSTPTPTCSTTTQVQKDTPKASVPPSQPTVPPSQPAVPPSQPSKPVQTQKDTAKISAPPSKPLTAVAVTSSSLPSSSSSSSSPSTSSTSSSSSTSSHHPPPPPSQPAKPTPVSNGAPPSAQTNGGSVGAAQAPPPKPQRPEVKAGSTKDSTRTAPSSKLQGSYRSGDREYSRDFGNRANRSQVFNRPESRPPSMGRGRYRERERGDRDRDRDKRSANYRSQSRPSPKPLRKQAPPPPPTPPSQTDKSPTVTSATPKQDTGSTSSTSSASSSNSTSNDTPLPSANVAKSDGKPSYAQITQKTPVPPPPKQSGSNSNGNNARSGTSASSNSDGRDKEQATSPGHSQQQQQPGKTVGQGPATTGSSERSSSSSSGKEKESCEQTSTSLASPEPDRPPLTPSKQTAQEVNSGSSSSHLNSGASSSGSALSMATSIPLPSSPPSSTTASPDSLSLTSN